MSIAMARPSAAPHSAGFSARRGASSSADTSPSSAGGANGAHTASSPFVRPVGEVSAAGRPASPPLSSPASAAVAEPPTSSAVAFASSASRVTLASALRSSAPETQARRRRLSAAAASAAGSAAARSAAITTATSWHRDTELDSDLDAANRPWPMPAAQFTGDGASAASAAYAAAETFVARVETPGVETHARNAPAAAAASASPPGLEPGTSPAARTSMPTNTPCAQPPSQKEAWQARNASRAAVSASAGLAPAATASNAVRPRCCATKRQLARPSASSVTSDANTHVASVACAGADTEASTCMAMHCTYLAGSASEAEQAASYVEASSSQRGSGTGCAPPASTTGDPDAPAAVEDAAASTTNPSTSAMRDARTIARVVPHRRPTRAPAYARGPPEKKELSLGRSSSWSRALGLNIPSGEDVRVEKKAKHDSRIFP